MNKTVKLITSIFATIALLVSIIPMGVFANSANVNSAQDDAIRWISEHDGWWENVNGDQWGCQCVDLILAYYLYLVGYYVSGNACDYCYMDLPQGWYRDRTPAPGCIVAWEANAYAGTVDDGHTWVGEYGHVALVHTVLDSGVIKTLETNYYVADGSYPGAKASFHWRNPENAYYIHPFASTPIHVDLGSDFYAFIIKQDSWKHLAAENYNLQLSSTGNNSGDPKQIWHFIRQSTGAYKIVNEYDGICLDAANFGTSNGTNVGMCASNDSNAQRWFIYSKGSGYAISPAYTSMVIDIDNNSNSPGANAQLWQPANTPAQVFSIYKLTEDGVNYSKPAKPSAVTVSTSVSSDKVLSISWSQSPLNGYYDKRAYDVYIYKDSASSTPIHTKMSLSATSYTYSLPSEGTYYVKVAAVNTKYYGWYTFSSAVKAETKKDMLGDMDGDASITVSDALAALRVAAKLARATSSVMKIADVDFDGTITVSDALAILRVAAKLAGTKTLTVQSLSSCTLYPECYKTYKVSSNYGETHVEWSSSDASVASVGSNGKVTAKTAGTATITAKVIVIGQQKSVSFTVTVKNPGVVLSPATQNTSFDAYSDNRVVIGGHIAYKCPLPTVTTDVNEAYFGDSNQSVSAVTKQITSGDGKFSGGYFYSYQPGTIKIKYSFTLAGKIYSSTYTCNFTLTRTNPSQGQYIRSSTSTSSANLGMVPKGTTYVITQVAVTGTVGTSGCQVWGYTTYDGVSGWTLIEYWD